MMDPGRVRLGVWEAIVGYWRTRAESQKESSNATLVARYGLQGPPAQQRAAAHLGEMAKQYGEYPEHTRQIVRFAYHEADGYLQAHTPNTDGD